MVKFIVPPAMNPFTKQPIYNSVAFVANNISDQLHYFVWKDPFHKLLQCDYFSLSLSLSKITENLCAYRIRKYHDGQGVLSAESITHQC